MPAQPHSQISLICSVNAITFNPLQILLSYFIRIWFFFITSYESRDFRLCRRRQLWTNYSVLRHQSSKMQTSQATISLARLITQPSLRRTHTMRRIHIEKQFGSWRSCLTAETVWSNANYNRAGRWQRCEGHTQLCHTVQEALRGPALSSTTESWSMSSAKLQVALTWSRHFWQQENTDREFLLWVDQICINQHNLAQRSWQVGFMREIHESADQVLVCLSTRNRKRLGMKWVVDLCKELPTLEDDLENDELKEKTYVEDFESDDEVPDYKAIERCRWFRLMEHIWRNVADRKFADGWIAFHDLLECQWWSRAWMSQEFMVAAQVCFLHGGQAISWNQLAPVLASYCSIQRYLPTIRDNKSIWDFEEDGPEDRQFQRVLERQARDGCLGPYILCGFWSRANTTGPGHPI